MGARLLDIVLDRGNGQPPQKLTLQPGHNLLLSGSQEAPGIFSRALLNTFFPVSGRSVPPSAVAEISRFGLTLESGPEIYRYALDCRAQGISLARRKAGESAFAAVSQAPDFVERVSRYTLHFPTLELYRELFVFALGRPASEAGTPSPEVADYFSGLAGESEESQDDHQRLSELLALQRRYEDLVRLERSQIEKQGALFKIEEAKTKLQELSESLRQAKAEYAQYAPFDEIKGLPADFPAAVQEYKVLQVRREDELRQLDERAEKLMRQALVEMPRPLPRHPVFWGGIGGLLGTLALASSYAQLRLPLLPVGIACTALSAYHLVVYLLKRDNTATLREAIHTLEQEKRELLKKYAAEKPALQTLMDQFSLRDPEEVLGLLRERKQALAQVDEAAAELEKAGAATDRALLEKDQARLTLELAALDKRMAELSMKNSGQDPAMVQQEIEALQERLGMTDLAVTGAGASRLAGKGPFERLVVAAALLLAMKPSELAKRVKPALDANLQWLSGKQYGELLWEGATPAAVRRGGQTVPLAQLDGAAASLVFFALRFTLLQGIGQKQPLPVIVHAEENPELPLPPAAITRALAHLSKSIQVLHPTADPRFREGAGPVLTF